ncbi:hypothetical protein Tco_0550958 [Tanacetum coccineum]
MKIGFSRVHVPLFDSMLPHDQSGQGEGLTSSVESQHTPTTYSPSTSHHTTSQPTTSQSSLEPTTEPITTTSSPESQDTQIPQTTTFVPHDTPLSGGYTPGSVEGSMKLQELTDLCTKLVDRVTSLETKLKTTKEVYDKALTKLVKKDLASEDPSKQERMEATEYADVEEEFAGVEHDFNLSEQQVTPSKAPQVEVQSQKTFEAELNVLSAAKILTDASNERAKRKGTDSSQLQKQLDQERKEADDIDWQKIFDQVQERQYASMIRYQTLKKKPVTVAQSRKFMMIYLKNMANYKMTYFKEPKDLSEEDVRKMLEIVSVEEFRVEALQTKYPIIDWEIHTEDSRKYWKIIRAMKEKFTSAVPVEDMEKALWVELKRLYEPDKDDTLWKLQRYMHDPLTWILYGSCEVHHVSSPRGHDIFMLIERNYPLTTVVMGLMLSRRLQVEEDSEMARN